MDETGAPPPATPPPAAPAAPGASAAVVTADFMTRLIAYIIDGVVIGIATAIVNAILGNFGIVGWILTIIADIAIAAGYFIYLWMNRRATLGMQLMKLQVLRADDGGTLTQQQAIRRWLYLGLPTVLSVALGAGAAIATSLAELAILFFLAWIVAIVSIIWLLWLAYQTNKDPNGQGPHDKAAGSVVVKLPA